MFWFFKYVPLKLSEANDNSLQWWRRGKILFLLKSVMMYNMGVSYPARPEGCRQQGWRPHARWSWAASSQGTGLRKVDSE